MLTDYIQLHVGDGCGGPVKVRPAPVIPSVRSLHVVNDQTGRFEVTPEESATSEDLLFRPVSGLGVGLTPGVVAKDRKSISLPKKNV
jgi:hypothetical protein